MGGHFLWNPSFFMGFWGSLDSCTFKGKRHITDPCKGLYYLPMVWKTWLCRACSVLGTAGAGCATSGALLEGRGAAESRKVKEQGGWSIVSWNLATGLHWAFLHLQKLPWYFNNCGWFNGSSGRQQHWYSWVCATHITSYSFVVRQFSFWDQEEPTLCLLVYHVYHVNICCQVCPFMFTLQMCCVSSLQCSSLIAVEQGRCREKANWVHLQDMDKSFSALLFVIQLRWSQRHWLPFSKRICSARLSVNSGRGVPTLHQKRCSPHSSLGLCNGL